MGADNDYLTKLKKMNQPVLNKYSMPGRVITLSIRKTTCMLISVISFASCVKSISHDIPPASYQDAVYFYIPYIGHNTLPGNTSSSTITDLIAYNYSGNYSFYIGDIMKKTTLARDTFWLPAARILGNTSTSNREINITILDSASTTIAGKHYNLFSAYTMPADSFVTDKLGVVVLRTPELDTSTVTLTLQIQPSKDFPGPMFAADTVMPDHTFFMGNTFTLKITNQPIAPPYWQDVSGLMDTPISKWSKVKYEFIHSVTGAYLGLTPNNIVERQNLFGYVLQLHQALLEYNNAHLEPLTDEFGIPIDFN